MNDIFSNETRIHYIYSIKYYVLNRSDENFNYIFYAGLGCFFRSLANAINAFTI